MKLENEHVLGSQTPPRKSYNPFDSDDEIEDTNGYLKSNTNGFDIKSFETNADSLTFHLDSRELSWEEAILSHPQSHTVPADSNGEEVLIRKDTELFTDKTVTECDLPELMVCYKDNAYHSVKDIGIDEGVPAHDKVSVKSRDNHGSKNRSAILGLNGDLPHGDAHQELPSMEGLKTRSDDILEMDTSSQKHLQDPAEDSGIGINGDLPGRDEQQDVTYMEGLKFRSENVLEKDTCSQNLLQESVKDSGPDIEALERQHLADQRGTNDSTKVDEFENDSSKGKSPSSWENTGDLIENDGVVCSTSDPNLSESDKLNHRMLDKENEVSEEHGKYNVPSEHTQKSSAMPSIMDGPEASTEPSESRSEEATSSQSVDLPVARESADTGVANALSYNSKVESGSIILDFNSSTMVGEEEKEKSRQNEAVEKPPETQSMSRHDEGPPGSIMNAGMDNRVHGETSFSATMLPPASITYMGMHAHNGSISLRSESSAGSTRSFAFPVLQAEWNSSPVRMTKAEQRNFRKHRGWVHSVMCCRF